MLNIEHAAGATKHTETTPSARGNFKQTEASRPDWQDWDLQFSKTRDPNWQLGSGGNDSGESLKKGHIAIDPHEEGRSPASNYKLLISAIVPRPIGLISTRSADGSSTNLAPMSYTQMVAHDPPVFVVGFSGGMDRAKDTVRNILDTEECVINIISEHFIEAANATSINAPYGKSEWAVSGLHPAPCQVVKPSRVRESIFSVECNLIEKKEFQSKAFPGKGSGVLLILEGLRFWAREDAINEEKSLIDLAILKPMSRLGGIVYGRTERLMELPRPDWKETMSAENRNLLEREKVDGQ